MSESVTAFYAELAENYHYIFIDWQASVQRQGDILDTLIRAQSPSAQTLLDCACGIGTQALGLAQHGFKVYATDLSAEAVERARTEAENFGVQIDFGVADFRALERSIDGTFDVVLACDNSIAHLLTDADLSRALDSMHGRLNPGGLLVLSIRDYDRLAQFKPHAMPQNILDTDDGRRISFQVWDWADDGRSYALSHFTLKQHGHEWTTHVSTTELRALLRAELTALLEASGYVDIRWHLADATGYHQPLVTARRPTA